MRRTALALATVAAACGEPGPAAVPSAPVAKTVTTKARRVVLPLGVTLTPPPATTTTTTSYKETATTLEVRPVPTTNVAPSGGRGVSPSNTASVPPPSVHHHDHGVSAHLQSIRACESGSNYSTNTGNGYFGAYQADRRTWNNYKGYATANLAPPHVQDEWAAALYAQRGAQPWPVCGR